MNRFCSSRKPFSSFAQSDKNSCTREWILIVRWSSLNITKDTHQSPSSKLISRDSSLHFGKTSVIKSLLMLVGGISLGIYLGNMVASSNAQTAKAQSSSQDKERFFNSIYLDSFHDLPPESVGGVYVTLASNETGR